MEAFEALQKKSKVLLEDSILTQLHNELVRESIVCCFVNIICSLSGD